MRWPARGLETRLVPTFAPSTPKLGRGNFRTMMCSNRIPNGSGEFSHAGERLVCYLNEGASFIVGIVQGSISPASIRCLSQRSAVDVGTDAAMAALETEILLPSSRANVRSSRISQAGSAKRTDEKIRSRARLTRTIWRRPRVNLSAKTTGSLKFRSDFSSMSVAIRAS